MISQTESGLGSSQYTEVAALKTNRAFKVIAKQFNPVWSVWCDTNQGQLPDFGALIDGVNLWHWQGDTGRAILIATGISSDASSTSPGNKTAGSSLSMFKVSTTPYYLAAAADGIYYATPTLSYASLLSISSQTFYGGEVARNGVAAASSYYTIGNSSYPPDGAFDGTGVNQWQTPVSTTTGWISYDLGAGITRKVIKYKITAPGTTAPKNWTFEGSNNNSSWTTLDTRTNSTGWASPETRTFTFSNTTGYRYYRLNVSANDGGTQLFINALQMFETSTDASIIAVAGVDTRCHYIYADAATRTFNLRVHAGLPGTSTSSDIWLTDRPRSIQAATDGTYDYVLVETEFPGRTTAVLEGTDLKHKRLKAQGLLCFKYNISEKSWAKHSLVDSVEEYDSTWNYVKNSQISYINSTLFVTAVVGSGTKDNPISSTRVYQSKNGIDWSLPSALYLGASQGSEGVKLLQSGDYVYAVQGRYIFRSYVTDMFGATATAVQSDITAYVDQLSINQSDMSQVMMSLDNSSGWLDAHAFINNTSTAKFDIYLGAYIADGTKQVYPFTSVYMDTFEKSDAVNGNSVEYMVDVSCRDNLSWMTDWAIAEDAHIPEVYEIGADNYNNTTDSVYGGLGHVATLYGEFQTADGYLVVPQRNNSNVTYGQTTLIDYLWNGSIQVGMLFPSMSAAYAGIIFRGKSDNSVHRFWTWYYDQGDDKVHLSYHDNWGSNVAYGGQTLIYSSSAKSWTGITSSNRYLRVEMWYGQFFLYSSSDGIAWTLDTTYKPDYSLKQEPGRTSYDATVRPYDYMESGYVGVMASPSYSGSALNPAGGVYFSSLSVNNFGRPMTVERGIKLFTNYANINTWSFDDLYTGGTSNWTLGSGVTVGAGPAFTADASPTGWRNAIQTGAEIPSNHVIEFGITGYGWGVLTRGDGTNHWLVGLDASGHPTIEKWNGSAYTQVASRPSTYSNTAAYKVQMSFQEIRYGKDTNLWNAVSLWINEKLAITYIEKATSLLNTTVHIGFAVRHSTTKTFSSVRVPELCDMAEAITIDQGESAMSALQRAIEGRYLRLFSRYNGAIRVYRPKQISSSFTITTAENHKYNFDKNTIKTYIRMVGAYEYSEYHRTDLTAKYGWLFKETQNPYLMSEYECQREAVQELKRLEEGAINDRGSTSFQHFMEVGDRVTFFGNDRKVQSLTIQLTPVQLVMDLTTKGYVYG